MLLHATGLRDRDSVSGHNRAQHNKTNNKFKEGNIANLRECVAAREERVKVWRSGRGLLPSDLGSRACSVDSASTVAKADFMTNLPCDSVIHVKNRK